MKCFIIDTFIGIFAVDETGNILNYIFIDNKNQIIEFYQLLDNMTISNEFKKFLTELENSGFNYFIFDNLELESITSQNLSFQTTLDTDALEFRDFRFNLSKSLAKVGINISEMEVLNKVKAIEEELIKKKVSILGAQNDIIIIKAIDSIDTIKKSISLYSSRLREWYGLHFPELTDKLIEDNITIAQLVHKLGDRDNFTFEKIRNDFEFKDDHIKMLENLASKSMGATIKLDIIQNFAEQIITLDHFREQLEEYLENLMKLTAPNLNALVGSLVGAKLIAKAGSLKKLAFMPASRIQILGAEKALYRFLKTGENRPKHGLIYQWNLIRGSKPHQRGKISRLIAGKIGIACKVDYFGGMFIGEELAKEIEEKVKEIERKYPKVPKSKIKTKHGKKRKR
ncbi:MAG: C/D box methylation guide ribonucleoprotein complex aNOP56 subunit [Candidatus Hodarchaeota archaeon]